MKNSVKKAAVAALVCVTSAGMLAGCGNKKLDGTATAITINDEQVPLGIISLEVRQQQAQAEAMYRSFMGGNSNSSISIWDTKMSDGDGETYGEDAVNTVVESIERMYLEKEHASDYKVELTDDDEKAIADAAKAFMEANTEDTLAELAVSEDQVKTYLELETYENRVKEAIKAEADPTVDEKEYQQSAFTYVSVQVSGDDLSDDDVKKNEKNIQSVLDKMKEDPSADMDEVAKSVDENMSSLQGTFPTYEEGDENVSETAQYPEDLRKALRKLDEGALTDIIKTDTTWYVARLDSKNDESASDTKKDSLIESKKTDHYTEVTDGWKDDAKIKEEKKVLKKLKVTDNHSFTVQTPTPEVTETPAEEETTEATETPEVTEAATTEAEEATTTPEAEATEEATETPEATEAEVTEAAEETEATEATETPEVTEAAK